MHERHEKWIQNFNKKPVWKRPFRTPQYGWDNNIEIYVKEIGCEGVNRIKWTQDTNQWQARVNMAMNLWVP
jgi:hypothetical protein